MKAKMTTITLALCLCAALLSGCGGNNSAAVTYTTAPSTTESSSPTPTTTIPVETIEPSPEFAVPSENEIFYTETYSLVRDEDHPLKCFAFSDDNAWATLYNEETRKTKLGLINKRGEVVHLLDLEKLGKEPSDIRISQFINGLSIVDNTIINQYGEEMYSLQDDSFEFLWYADDGTFILLKHTDATFASTSSDYFCIMDADFEVKETGVEYIPGFLGTAKLASIPADGLVYLGEGLYMIPSSLDKSDLLNLNTGSWIYSSRGSLDGYRIKCYNDQYIIGEKSTFGFSPQYLIPISLLSTAKTFDDVINMMDEDNYIAKYTEKYILSNWRGNSIKHDKHEGYDHYEYIDLTGNTIFTYPELPEGAEYNRVDDFSGGYSALSLKGADKETYVALVDESGSMQYDPVRFTPVFSCNGYVIGYQPGDSEPSAITPSGEIKMLGESIEGLAETEAYSAKGDVAIAGGYIYWTPDRGNPKYFSTTGSKTIDQVYANYNFNGSLLYSDNDGKWHINESSPQIEFEVDATDDNSPATYQEQKTYVTLNSFSIEGKWKNIGSYTFGQVDNGGIVSFDGTYCNLYSPRDTYAFYKDGDSYRLDTTSLLGEPTSFTVKIVDKNNIDVYYGSDYLELTRVS